MFIDFYAKCAYNLFMEKRRPNVKIDNEDKLNKDYYDSLFEKNPSIKKMFRMIEKTQRAIEKTDDEDEIQEIMTNLSEKIGQMELTYQTLAYSGYLRFRPEQTVFLDDYLDTKEEIEAYDDFDDDPDDEAEVQYNPEEIAHDFFDAETEVLVDERGPFFGVENSKLNIIGCSLYNYNTYDTDGTHPNKKIALLVANDLYPISDSEDLVCFIPDELISLETNQTQEDKKEIIEKAFPEIRRFKNRLATKKTDREIFDLLRKFKVEDCENRFEAVNFFDTRIFDGINAELNRVSKLDNEMYQVSVDGPVLIDDQEIQLEDVDSSFKAIIQAIGLEPVFEDDLSIQPYLDVASPLSSKENGWLEMRIPISSLENNPLSLREKSSLDKYAKGMGRVALNNLVYDTDWVDTEENALAEYDYYEKAKQSQLELLKDFLDIYKLSSGELAEILEYKTETVKAAQAFYEVYQEVKAQFPDQVDEAVQQISFKSGDPRVMILNKYREEYGYQFQVDWETDNNGVEQFDINNISLTTNDDSNGYALKILGEYNDKDLPEHFSGLFAGFRFINGQPLMKFTRNYNKIKLTGHEMPMASADMEITPAFYVPITSEGADVDVKILKDVEAAVEVETKIMDLAENSNDPNFTGSVLNDFKFAIFGKEFSYYQLGQLQEVIDSNESIDVRDIEKILLLREGSASTAVVTVDDINIQGFVYGVDKNEDGQTIIILESEDQTEIQQIPISEMTHLKFIR